MKVKAGISLNYVPLPNKMTAAPQHGRRNILEPKER